MPNKPKNLPTVGGKNSGEPVCPIAHEQKDAPWMEIAYKEAKERWHWGYIQEGSGGINYHHETGAGNPTMVGTRNAWCASFINYCLQCTGYPIANANSQSFSKSRKFVKIDSPVYGAIVVLHVPNTEQKGHATLVYCKTKDGEIGVLGGNQGDSVTINPLKKVYLEELHYELIGYYVPKDYECRAKNIVSTGSDLSPVYNSIGDVRQAVGSDVITSGDVNTR
ncbi:hypothetical protein EYW98_22030 [Escherichia coli]|nr:hypothetical protein [Escherichia coli]EGO8379435.1 hypothetical protein [Escherichia coli]